MEERPDLSSKPVLQKPPGYRDPLAPPRANLPVRTQPLPPSFRNIDFKRGGERSRRSCFRKLCCWVFVLFLVLSFAVAVAGGLSYLWFQPKLPSFRLESVQIPKFNITFKNDAAFLDSETVIRIKIANPNRMIKISYAPIEASIIIPGDGDIADTSLGSGTHPALDVDKKNSSVIEIETKTKGAAIDEILAKKLQSQFHSKTLKILVEIRTNLKTPKIPSRFLCGDLTLKQIDSGASPKCTINIFKWITLH